MDKIAMTARIAKTDSAKNKRFLVKKTRLFGV